MGGLGIGNSNNGLGLWLPGTIAPVFCFCLCGPSLPLIKITCTTDSSPYSATASCGNLPGNMPTHFLTHLLPPSLRTVILRQVLLTFFVPWGLQLSQGLCSWSSEAFQTFSLASIFISPFFLWLSASPLASSFCWNDNLGGWRRKGINLLSFSHFSVLPLLPLFQH